MNISTVALALTGACLESLFTQIGTSRLSSSGTLSAIGGTRYYGYLAEVAARFALRHKLYMKPLLFTLQMRNLSRRLNFNETPYCRS